MKREPSPPDLDALQQRVSDLEALITSPGWALLNVEASKTYGLKVFAADLMALGRSTLNSAQTIGERAIALVAARNAVAEVLGMPERLLEETKRKASDVPPERKPGLGKDVEMTS